MIFSLDTFNKEYGRSFENGTFGQHSFMRNTNKYKQNGVQDTVRYDREHEGF